MSDQLGNTGFLMFRLKNAGYCCTQIMLKLALDEEEKENKDLLRAANGLCMGIGSSQKICGVLTGGIMVLGLYAGKGADREFPNPIYSQMVDEYTDWFEATYESTECRDIIGVCTVTDYLTNQEYLMKCGDIMVQSFEKIVEILESHDFTFGDRE